MVKIINPNSAVIRNRSNSDISVDNEDSSKKNNNDSSILSSSNKLMLTPNHGDTRSNNGLRYFLKSDAAVTQNITRNEPTAAEALQVALTAYLDEKSGVEVGLSFSQEAAHKALRDYQSNKSTFVEFYSAFAKKALTSSVGAGLTFGFGRNLGTDFSASASSNTELKDFKSLQPQHGNAAEIATQTLTNFLGATAVGALLAMVHAYITKPLLDNIRSDFSAIPFEVIFTDKMEKDLNNEEENKGTELKAECKEKYQKMIDGHKLDGEVTVNAGMVAFFFAATDRSMFEPSGESLGNSLGYEMGFSAAAGMAVGAIMAGVMANSTLNVPAKGEDGKYTSTQQECMPVYAIKTAEAKPAEAKPAEVKPAAESAIPAVGSSGASDVLAAKEFLATYLAYFGHLGRSTVVNNTLSAVFTSGVLPLVSSEDTKFVLRALVAGLLITTVIKPWFWSQGGGAKKTANHLKDGDLLNLPAEGMVAAYRGVEAPVLAVGKILSAGAEAAKEGYKKIGTYRDGLNHGKVNAGAANAGKEDYNPIEDIETSNANEEADNLKSSNEREKHVSLKAVYNPKSFVSDNDYADLSKYNTLVSSHILKKADENAVDDGKDTINI